MTLPLILESLDRRCAILRHGTGKEKARSISDLRRIAGHNDRTAFEPRENIDTNRSHLNEVLIGSGDTVKDVLSILATHGLLDDAGNPPKRRTIAVELFLGASPEALEEMDEDTRAEWRLAQVAAVRGEFEADGVSRIAALTCHRDEVSDHFHAVIVPLVRRAPMMSGRRPKSGEARREWEARRASGPERSDLCVEEAVCGFRPRQLVCEVAKGLITKEEAKRIREEERERGAQALRDRQTRYAKAMERFGLVRGEEGSERGHAPVSSWKGLRQAKMDLRAKALEVMRFDEAMDEARSRLAQVQSDIEEAIAAKSRAAREASSAVAQARKEAASIVSSASFEAAIQSMRQGEGYRAALRSASVFLAAASADLSADRPSPETAKARASFIAAHGSSERVRDWAVLGDAWACRGGQGEDALGIVKAWKLMSDDEELILAQSAKGGAPLDGVRDAFEGWARGVEANADPSLLDGFDDLVGKASELLPGEPMEKAEAGLFAWLRRRAGRLEGWGRDRRKDFSEMVEGFVSWAAQRRVSKKVRESGFAKTNATGEEREKGGI